jgi:hypothetical protein
VTEAWPGYRPANALRGALIYGGGDALAAAILGEFSLVRLAGMAALGGSLYALEVPNWFHWIDRRVAAGTRISTRTDIGTGTTPGWWPAVQRTALALAYFNPLWIARHLLIIAWLRGDPDPLHWGLLATATWAFLANLPLALLANYGIQNLLPARLRFTASALYSALMAVYYAAAEALFGPLR